jgi:alpha-D-xyloside xylohydrolase
MDYPDDPALINVDDEYLVGDRLLVAPLFAGEEERSVILPEGEWHDLWTGAPVRKGRTFTVSRDTRNIPVFIKSGSVLPWAEVAQHDGSEEGRHLDVLVYGDGSLAWSAPESAGGLRLHWDKAVKQGTIEQKKGRSPLFQVKQWRQMD